MTKSGEAQNFLEEALKWETDECILWPYACVHGYGIIRKFGQNIYVHRIALKRRKGPCPEGKEAAHSCRNANCFNYRHLDWKTHQQNNVEDRIRDGTYPDSSGELHGNHRLLENHVHWIRYQLRLGVQTKRIAEYLEVGRETITNIKLNRRWKKLPIQDPYIRVWEDLT